MTRLFSVILFVCMTILSGLNAQDNSSSALESVRKMFDGRNYEAALILVNDALDNASDNTDLLFLKGQILEKLKLNTEAVSGYDELITILVSQQELDSNAKKMLDEAKKNVLRLDPARKLIIKAADDLQRKALQYKDKDEVAYSQLMEMVDLMYGDWSFTPGKLQSSQKVKKIVKKRALGFAGALVQDKTKEALEYVDPRTRLMLGDAVLENVLRGFAKALRNNKIKRSQIGIKEIALSEGRKSARVTPTYNRGATYEGDDQFWLEVEGQWYLGDEKELKKFREEKDK